MEVEFLKDKEIIVASNRGPVLFKRDDRGKIELIRGRGNCGSMIPFMQKLVVHGFLLQLENVTIIWTMNIRVKYPYH